ncbi:MAG: hypothetical protein A2V93_09830 [Ignavibacteria bacterium RBG_16_34_14]|nr:MAG: hypothetical protein A2V93_09830 [Ignavibacteria bacterium RBG_16_34_14]
MNKNTYLSVILFLGLFSANNFAQSAFPLEVGNTWYYEITYEFYYPPRPPSYYTYKVVDDTIMINGKRYWIIDPGDMLWGRYIRSDTQSVYYWEPNCNNGNGCELEVFNLNNSIGEDDTINWGDYLFATLQGLYQTTLFNHSTNIYEYFLGGLIFSYISFSNKFGYTSFYYMGDYQYERDNWQLKGCIISDTLYGEMTDVEPVNEIPNKMDLFQNYPNPFNPTTSIQYAIGSEQFITLKVYDVLGNEVSTLVNEEKPAGEYKVKFQSSVGNQQLASGIYFYQLKAGDFISTKKIILIK